MSQTKALARTLACVLGLSAALFGAKSRAHEEPGPPAVAPAAESKRAKETDLAAEPKRRAREAFARAQQARSAADRTHAPLLTALGNAWATLAADLVRVAKAEAAATKLENELNDIETKLVRARTLLEETLARRGRAAAELEELESPRGSSAEGTPAEGEATP